MEPEPLFRYIRLELLCFVMKMQRLQSEESFYEPDSPTTVCFDALVAFIKTLVSPRRIRTPRSTSVSPQGSCDGRSS